jgi:GDP-L-fucose synthase
VTIEELARVIMRIVGLPGEIRYRSEMPDGTPRKLLDVSRLIALGWRPKVPLEEGLAHTYRAFLRQMLEGDAA